MVFKEIKLLKQIITTYNNLNLKKVKIIMVVVLMLSATFLEMLGLSVLYPLIILLNNKNELVLTSNNLIATVTSYFSYYDLTHVLILYSLVFIAKNMILLLSYRYNIGFATYFYKHVMKSIYNSYLKMDILKIQQDGSGYLTNMMCHETRSFIDGAVRPILVITSEAVIIIGLLFVSLMLSPGLILTASIFCVIGIFIYYYLFHYKAINWGKKELEVNSVLNQTVQSTVSGINTIKIFKLDNFLKNKIDNITELRVKLFHKLEMYQIIPRYLAETLFMLAIFFSIYMSFKFSLSILNKNIIAEFAIVAAAALRMLPSINRVIGSYSVISYHFSPAMSVLKFINSIKQEKTNLYEGYNSEEKNKFNKISKIEFINISFKYPNAKKIVLNNLSLSIDCINNKKIGILGKSGSGKSTLCKLLTGLYRPSHGKILINGVNINSNNLYLDFWQGTIGYVYQEPFILPDTMENNIIFGAKLNEVWLNKCLDLLGIDNHLQNFENGVKTKIGSGNINLSGGQKQLICLARAIYRRPKILILDEPTSSLDSVSEKLVMESISKLEFNIPIIMISHNKNNFLSFDMIYSSESYSMVEIVC